MVSAREWASRVLLRSSGGDGATRLWRRYGGHDHRPDYRFDPSYYLARNDDVRDAGVAGEEHYRTDGRRQGRFGNAYSEMRALLGADLDVALLDLLTDDSLRRAVVNGEPDAAEVTYELIALGPPIDTRISRFSREHYLATHPDVSEVGSDPLSHYLRYGRSEGRRTIADETVRSSASDAVPGGREAAPAEGAAGLWQRHGGHGHRPDYRFDPLYYLARNGDVRETGKDPDAHYRSHGQRQGRHPNAYAEARAALGTELDAVLLDLLTDDDLRAAVAAGEPDASEVAFELIALGSGIDGRISDFSREHYLATHPDVSTAGLDPLLHYVRYGRAERRRTLAELRARVFRGERPFDPGLPTIVVGSHDLSTTGAPVVALRIAEEAAERNNVVVMTGEGGPLLDRARAASCAVVVGDDPHLDWDHYGVEALAHVRMAVLNSVESWHLVPALVARGIPFTTYVHEFHNYILPSFKAKLAALYSESVAFSSSTVRETWEPMLHEVGFDLARDGAILPQEPFEPGRVDPDAYVQGRRVLSELIGEPTEGRRIVYGAGRAQMRKGTDLFAMAAQHARALDPSVLFVWIGDGANPGDIHYGAWLDKHLVEAHANEPGSNLHAIPAGPHYADVCAAADAMFLSSRLDPLPNVVFDAARHGTPVVLFEGASGFDDPRYRDEPSLARVGYGDVPGAVRKLLDLPLKSEAVARRRSEPSPRPASELFGPLTATLPTDRLPAPEGAVGEFDVSILFDGGARSAEARRRERALLLRKERLAIWSGVAEAEQLLAQWGGWMHERTAIVAHAEHDAGDPAPAEPPPFAIHAHAHYLAGLADDMRLPAYRMARRVVVTTGTSENAALIERMGAAAGLVPDVRVVPNQGRDILPFLRAVAADGGDDDTIWCHVHQKRSVGSATGGDVWRAFLIRLLLGHGEMVSSALAEIAKPDVGLVAAFDPHILGWGASRRLIPDMERRLKRTLPPHPLLFPVGQMMWVRAGVARGLLHQFGANYPWPNEPLPDDGTVYHMIERLWPAAAALRGRASVFLSNPAVARIP